MRRSSGLFGSDELAALNVSAPGRGWRSPAARSLRTVAGLSDPVSAMLALARELVEEVGSVRPAQNLKLLASFRDIVEVQEVKMAESGRLIPMAEGLVIQVNAQHSSARRNFSAAHEICHTFFPYFQSAPALRVDASTGMYAEDEEEEYLCDLGASEILMPTTEFRRALQEHGVTIGAVAHLAEEFGTSLEAAAIKCARCGPLAVVVWEPSLKPTQLRELAHPSLFDVDEVPLPPEKLRVKFAACGAEFETHFFPKHKSIDSGTLPHRAYESGEIVCGEETIPTGRGGIRCYTESQSFSFWRGEVLERKVITLLYGSPPTSMV